MKRFRLLSILLVLFALCALFACGKKEETPNAIDYDKKNIDLVVGEEFVVDIKQDVTYSIQGEVCQFNQETKTLKAIKAGLGSLIVTLKADKNVTLTIVLKVVDKTLTFDEVLKALDIKDFKSFECTFELIDNGYVVYYEKEKFDGKKHETEKSELNDTFEGNEFVITKKEEEKEASEFNLAVELDKESILSSNIKQDEVLIDITKSGVVKFYNYTMDAPKITIKLSGEKVISLQFDFEVYSFLGKIVCIINY